jgi:hypothetical protein
MSNVCFCQENICRLLALSGEYMSSVSFVRRNICQHILNKQNWAFKYTYVACINMAFNYSSTSLFHYQCTSINLVLTVHTVNGNNKLHYQTVKATTKLLRSHSLTLL